MGTTTTVFNSIENRTVMVPVNITICTQANRNVTLAQDLIFIIIRVILPFIIMVTCNIVLIRHVAISRNKVIRGSNQRREHSFTIAVAILNGSFMAFNLGAVVLFIITYYIRFSGNRFTVVGSAMFVVYQTVSILVAYSFGLLQFWLDLIFNRIFRQEMRTAFLILIGQRNKVYENTSSTSSNSTQSIQDE